MALCAGVRRADVSRSMRGPAGPSVRCVGASWPAFTRSHRSRRGPASATARWRSQLSALPPPGADPVILAGDFNATLDHAAFRRLLDLGYADAASQVGNGLAATWGPRPHRRPGAARDRPFPRQPAVRGPGDLRPRAPGQRSPRRLCRDQAACGRCLAAGRRADLAGRRGWLAAAPAAARPDPVAPDQVVPAVIDDGPASVRQAPAEAIQADVVADDAVADTPGRLTLAKNRLTR